MYRRCTLACRTANLSGTAQANGPVPRSRVRSLQENMGTPQARPRKFVWRLALSTSPSLCVDRGGQRTRSVRAIGLCMPRATCSPCLNSSMTAHIVPHLLCVGPPAHRAHATEALPTKLRARTTRIASGERTRVPGRIALLGSEAHTRRQHGSSDQAGAHMPAQNLISRETARGATCGFSRWAHHGLHPRPAGQQLSQPQRHPGGDSSRNGQFATCSSGEGHQKA